MRHIYLNNLTVNFVDLIDFFVDFSLMFYFNELIFNMESKYTEWPNPQIRGENRQSGLTD